MFLKPLRLHVVTLTANVRFKLRVIKMENEEEKNTSKQFLRIKLEWKYYFFSRSNWGKEKGNLGHVAQFHVCRQISLMTSLRTQTAYFRKIRLRSQGNIDQYYPKNAFIGVTSFNIIQFSCCRKKGKEIMKIAGVLHFNKSTIFFISQRLCVVSNKTKEPGVKSTTPPGLEPGIFWSEVRRLIH